MIGPSDEAVVSALTVVAVTGPHWWNVPYSLRVVGVHNHRVDLEVQQGPHIARVWLALPSSQRPMPWVQKYYTQDADGWVDGLVDWLNEEMDTGGIEGRAVETDAYGVRRMVVEGYGLRVADPSEHDRRHHLVGPNGWGLLWAHERGRGNIQRSYALQWALDQVEAQVAYRSADARSEFSESRSWDLLSPEGVAVHVEATAGTDQPGANLRATAKSRLSRSTALRSLQP